MKLKKVFFAPIILLSAILFFVGIVNPQNVNARPKRHAFKSSKVVKHTRKLPSLYSSFWYKKRTIILTKRMKAQEWVGNPYNNKVVKTITIPKKTKLRVQSGASADWVLIGKKWVAPKTYWTLKPHKKMNWLKLVSKKKDNKKYVAHKRVKLVKKVR